MPLTDVQTEERSMHQKVREARCGSCSQHELIDRLEAENERLRQALRDTRDWHAFDDDHPCEACQEELVDEDTRRTERAREGREATQ